VSNAIVSPVTEIVNQPHATISPSKVHELLVGGPKIEKRGRGSKSKRPFEACPLVGLP
jgi:hypothetical protein